MITRAYRLAFIYLFVIFIISVHCQSFNRTELDNFLNQYRMFRLTGSRFLGHNSENAENMRMAKSSRMLQDTMPPSMPFPCNVTGFRSEKPPKSVHRLRPGDIDVIGALGDSLTAGNGLVAMDLLHVFVENRGLSWSIGGQGTWREYITLPNILKVFNPNLVGYSLSDSISTDRNSQFNPAEPAGISSEIPYMSKVLVKRITKDPRVDVKNHWKLITVMFGANDFCLDVCYKNNFDVVLESHRRDLIRVLRTLRDNLPRTIVNLVPPPNVEVLTKLKNVPEQCNMANRFECICMFADQYISKRPQIFELVRKWQKLDKEISLMPEFHRDDFTVVYQPFMLGIEIPLKSENETDFSYLSKDCFHVSQKLNAEVALVLWNNMLEKVGQKSPIIKRPIPFTCPTEENPYLYTMGNSH